MAGGDSVRAGEQGPTRTRGGLTKADHFLRDGPTPSILGLAAKEFPRLGGRTSFLTHYPMQLTELDIEQACRTENGGAKTFLTVYLGVDPKVKGWLHRMRGMEIDRDRYDQLVSTSQLPRAKGLPRGECKGQTALF